jgi:hypothetical protein
MKKSVFENMVDKAFLDLQARYGFKKVETKYAQRGAFVRYQNSTTGLLLNYEIGETPWLEISDGSNPENKSTLGWLLVELGLDKAPTPAQAFSPTALGDDKLEPVLQKMGQQAREHAAALLQGDFSILPKLQARARKYDQECQRYLAIRKTNS